MKPLVGHLLITPPEMRDLDFVGTVILLIQHSEEQAFGVVLNQPTTTTMRQAWRGRCQRDGFLYSGGPVSGPLLTLHTNQALGEIEVLPGVYYFVAAVLARAWKRRLPIAGSPAHDGINPQRRSTDSR